MKPAVTASAGPPLWQLLQATAQGVAAVRQGQSATKIISEVRADLRPGVQALLYQSLRYLGRAMALRAQLARRAPPPAADALLCTALALAWHEDLAPYAPHTLVNQAVEAAKRQHATQAQAPFLNACLRRFLRERDALVALTEADPVARWNHPRWWIEQLQKDHPTHWQAILQANQQAAPMTLRVQTRRVTREALQARWAQGGLLSQAVGEHGLVLETPRAVFDIPGFEEGLCSVQDAAAQRAASLLASGLKPNAEGRAWRLLDACAAPGGKTAHLLELLDAEVLALDVDTERCRRIGETLARLQLQADIRCADAGSPETWWDGRPFDGILLDAPCTASGIVRRHPDVRWLRRASDVGQLAAQQARLLSALWPLLQPGGVLLYCTCSVFKQEGQAQVQSFLMHNTGAILREAPGHLMPALTDNRSRDQDGFYYALLEKSGP
jgi:16S rRNA (cytosine967-C5)-methyltransferase